MKVLVTGASGRIGRSFVASCEGGPLDIVRSDLLDAGASPFPFLHLDVTDRDACRRAVAGTDAVVHLAADPSPAADWDRSVLPINVGGTYNVLLAAVEAGVPRVVYASSGQAVAGYPLDHQVRETDAPHPTNDYGAGKAFGEALCAAMAARSALTTVSVRIGYYNEERPPPSASLRDRMAWLSPADGNQLLRLATTAAVSGAVVVHGVSDNAAKQFSLVETRRLLGYDPVDDAFAGSGPAGG